MECGRWEGGSSTGVRGGSSTGGRGSSSTVGGVAVAQVGEAVGVLEVQPDSSSQLPLVPAG